MKITIDRFENGYAVCECGDGGFRRVPVSDLPEGAREGSVLLFVQGKYSLCGREERERRSRMEDKLAAILKKK